MVLHPHVALACAQPSSKEGIRRACAAFTEQEGRVARAGARVQLQSLPQYSRPPPSLSRTSVSFCSHISRPIDPLLTQLRSPTAFDSAPPIVLPSALPPAPSSMYSTTLPMAPASLPALHSSASPIPMISTSTAMAPLPALPSLPPPTAAYDAYNPFDYSYAPEPSYTSTSPINGSYDQWSTLPDFGASVGASLPLNHSLWAFDNSTSPSTSSSSPQSSHFLDDHAASPDSLHSTWSDFPPSPPHLADDLSSCFLASADKYDDTLTLPLFPLMLPPKVEEPTLAWNWMEPVGFGSVEQQRW